MRRQTKRHSSSLCMFALVIMLFLPNGYLSGQEDYSEKKKARITLDYLHTTSETPMLRAIIKTREEGIYQTVPGVKVAFFLDQGGGALSLGEAISNSRGVALLPLTTAFSNHSDSIFSRHFSVRIQGQGEFYDADKEIVITESQMEMGIEVIDSIPFVQVYFGVPDSTGRMVPLEEMLINLFVERLFGALPIGDDYEMTDVEGLVSVQLPAGIPGDVEGNLRLIARTESDEYGLRSARITVPYGQALAKGHQEWEKATLYSARSNVPLPLLLTVNGLLLGIWAVIIYILVQIFQIRKVGAKSSS